MLIDRSGRLVELFSYGTPAEQIAADISEWLEEGCAEQQSWFQADGRSPQPPPTESTNSPVPVS
jgi:hypothetical protein